MKITEKLNLIFTDFLSLSLSIKDSDYMSKDNPISHIVTTIRIIHYCIFGMGTMSTVVKGNENAGIAANLGNQKYHIDIHKLRTRWQSACDKYIYAKYRRTEPISE